MVVGDPALVIALAVAAASGTGRLGSRDGLGLDDNRLLNLLGSRGAGAANLLGEERLDPGLVDEVEGGAEDAGQEEIEEDAVR
jgi:hypothetical protein